MTAPPPGAAEMTRTMLTATPQMVPWRSQGRRSRAQRVAIGPADRKAGAAGRSGSPSQPSRPQGRRSGSPGRSPRQSGATNFRPEWSSTTTKRHTCGCDECGRDLGYCYHGARTFAQPPQHGQCRHHSLAFQRIDVLCWTVRVLLHRTCAGGRQLAAPADRAESLPGRARHAGADRLVVHLPDGGVRGRARRRVRAAPLVRCSRLRWGCSSSSARATSTTT